MILDTIRRRQSKWCYSRYGNKGWSISREFWVINPIFDFGEASRLYTKPCANLASTFALKRTFSLCRIRSAKCWRCAVPGSTGIARLSRKWASSRINRLALSAKKWKKFAPRWPQCNLDRRPGNRSGAIVLYYRCYYEGEGVDLPGEFHLAQHDSNSLKGIDTSTALARPIA